jgi:arylsulfatase A-like enzyme
MAELDDIVGRLFGKLDGLGIAKSTIVLFTTDNGVEIFSWPDGGNIPFRGEKGTTWEGGFPVPAFVRWPGVIKPEPVVNAVMSHEDWLPTFLAAAGVPDIKQQLLRGYKVGDKTFKNHLDGYNFMPFFKGETAKAPRREVFYFDDNASLNAMRYDDWKINFKWTEGNLFTGSIRTANVPIIVNLSRDWRAAPFVSLRVSASGDSQTRSPTLNLSSRGPGI